MALKNKLNHIMVVGKSNGGHVTLEVFKSEAARLAFQQNNTSGMPSPENAPWSRQFYIGDKVEKAMESIKDLGTTTMADKYQSLVEDAVFETLRDSYEQFPRTSFEVSDWVKI